MIILTLKKKHFILPVAFLMVLACHEPQQIAVAPKPKAEEQSVAAEIKDTAAQKVTQPIPKMDATAGKTIMHYNNKKETTAPKSGQYGVEAVVKPDYKKNHTSPPPVLKPAPKPGNK